jgi:hypothetical protein
MEGSTSYGRLGQSVLWLMAHESRLMCGKTEEFDVDMAVKLSDDVVVGSYKFNKWFIGQVDNR